MAETQNPSFPEIRKLNRVTKKAKTNKGLCKKSGTLEVKTPPEQFKDRIVVID